MENKLESNPFKKGSKAYRFLNISDINYNNGHSRVVPTDEFPTDMKFGNGADWARDDGALGKRFNIERKKQKGEIVSVQLVGYKKNIFNRNISSNIHNYFKNSRCCVLDIASNSIEVDHKDGRYDGYMIDLKEKDCQPFHSSVNKAKRQHCKTCRETGIRYDARILGYSVPQYIGPKRYNGSCIGCYWYDPREFNKQVSKEYKKEK